MSPTLIRFFGTTFLKTAVYELYELQDRVEQYTRKNSLEIHGVPESAYGTTEEVVLKLAEAFEVPITSEDNEISYKLKRKGINKLVIAKFVNHKIKRNIYKSRAKLKTSKYSIYFLVFLLLLRGVLQEIVSSCTKSSRLTGRKS